MHFHPQKQIQLLSSFLIVAIFNQNVKKNLTYVAKFWNNSELQLELKLSDGEKIQFHGLSKNKGVVWVKWKDIVTHILINDLDESSQMKVNQLLRETKNEL